MKSLKGYLVVLLCGFMISCSNQKQKQDKYEEAICDCLYQSYDSLGFNFKKEILKFEDYLIKSGQLESSKGQSYMMLLKNMAEKGEISLKEDFSIGISNRDYIAIFYKCFYSQYNNPELINSDSKLNSIYSEYHKLANSKEINPKSITNILIKTLDSSDYEKEFYKYLTLNTYYQIFLLNKSKKSIGNNIHIYVGENQIIYLNGQFVILDSISSRIHNIISKYSDIEKETYVIKLIVNKNVKFGFVNSVKSELSDFNKKKIYFSILK